MEREAPKMFTLFHTWANNHPGFLPKTLQTGFLCFVQNKGFSIHLIGARQPDGGLTGTGRNLEDATGLVAQVGVDPFEAILIECHRGIFQPPTGIGITPGYHFEYW